MSQLGFFNFLAPFYEHIHWGAYRSAERLKSLVNFSASDQVLDLGGGTGRIAKYLASSVAHITVADASRGMITECRKKKFAIQNKLDCVLSPAEHLPFPRASFDTIIMVDAFHHFFDHRRVIQEVKRVLKPGGRVVLEEFHPQRFFGKLVMLLERLLHYGSTFFIPEKLARLWTEEGFEISIHNSQQSIYQLICERFQS